MSGFDLRQAQVNASVDRSTRDQFDKFSLYHCPILFRDEKRLKGGLVKHNETARITSEFATSVQSWSALPLTADNPHAPGSL